MFFRLRFIVCNLLLFNIAYADTTQTIKKSYYIDKSHKKVSKKIMEYSSVIDDKIIRIINNDKNNSIDYYFKNDKFLDETDDTFVGFRFASDFHSKDKDDFSLKLMAHIPLSRSKKEFNLSINNLDNKYSINKNNKLAPEIGLNYFILGIDDIKSKYSIGFGGIDFFARARYSKNFSIFSWSIEPVQTFKYSLKDSFYENTSLYIDKRYTKSTLFRILLHRQTKTDVDGMDYSLSLQYYYKTFNISQTFSGNTKYRFVTNDSSIPTKTEEYNMINNYTTAMRFRENIWREWFFYELKPSINFHKDNLYKPNYRLQFFIDIYFGNYKSS